MAIPTLHSLLESVRFHGYVRGLKENLRDKIELSLGYISYLANEIYNDEGSKAVAENIRKKAVNMEYLLESFISHRQSPEYVDQACTYLKREERMIREIESSALDIASMSTGLLNSHRPEFLNYQKELSDYVPCTVLNFSSLECNYLEVIFKSSDLETISLSGMMYIQKRALARQIFSNSLVSDSFVRVWLNVSSDDTVQHLLRGLLRQLMKLVDHMSNAELCDCLSKVLKGQKYFIVIDNMQCFRAWDQIRSSFPDNKNGSKILFTTTILTDIKVVDRVLNLESTMLDPSVDEKMFDHLVFGSSSFPQELLLIKLDILFWCQSSPPFVIMIAKFLSTINPTVDNWVKVPRLLEKILRGNPLVEERLHRKRRLNTDSFIQIEDDIARVLEEISEENPLMEERLQRKRRLNTDLLIKIKDDIPRTILAILNLSKYLSTDTEKSVLYGNMFDPEMRNPLDGVTHLEADEDNKHISTVGIDECLEILVSHLIQSSPQMEKLAIVGMAGIGKTTLALRIFHDQRVFYHFDIRAWVKISPVYCKRELLLQLLHCINQSRNDEIFGENDADLEELLHKSLRRRRYLIVMDDVWSTKAWTELKRFFPDDKMGSRVLLTSRQKVEMEFLNCKLIHQMSLLSDDRSWDLMQKKVFGQCLCPSDIVDTGKQIAKNCKGLPLAIVVIAGILSKIEKTAASWKAVAESVRSVVISNQNHCQSIFSLSYQHLPDHLKSCFLYMGAFPGSSEIKVRTLIRLWIAEGFIIQEGLVRLEDVAEGYLNDLIGRSLILAGRRRSNGRIKTCHLHDLLQEFCIQVAKKENFMNVIKDCEHIHSEESIDTRCRFSFQSQSYGDIYLTNSKSRAVSALFFNDCSSGVADILVYYFDFKMLRVLDIISLRFDTFPVDQVSKLLLLRYLAFTASFELPSSIFKLRKLQTLVVNGPWFKGSNISALPPEFWGCINLRHVLLRAATHLLPPEKPVRVSSLQSLYGVTLSSCTHSRFVGVAKIIELGICETHEDYLIDGLWKIFFEELVQLRQIQTLKLSCCGRNTRPLLMPSQNAFPGSLKKLTLLRSQLPWVAMTLLGELPKLEVLKLRDYAFKGPEWKTVEGGFQSLKYLLIEQTDLEVWNLEGSHFPQLQHIVLKFCNKLHELSNEVGEICALKQIEVHFCSAAAERSAKEIQEEQHSEYCNDIEVVIRTHGTMSTSSSSTE